MIRCREITTSDVDAVADLLARGFAERSREYWIGGLRRQFARDVPEGFPRLGYMLDNAEKPVGVLLVIYTARDHDGGISIRCNLSSWYVEPGFRNYATMLSTVAQRHKHVTYVNISPAHWTWRTIEAQGFRAYCSGLFFSFPALSRAAKGMRVEVVHHDARTIDGLSEANVALLARHAAYGCLSLVCSAADGACSPFILQPLRVRRIKVPAMQLIYCADVADYVTCPAPSDGSCSGTAGSRLLSTPTPASRIWSASTASRAAANTSKVHSVRGLPTCRTPSSPSTDRNPCSVRPGPGPQPPQVGERSAAPTDARTSFFSPVATLANGNQGVAVHEL